MKEIGMVCSFPELLRLAKSLADARKSGNTLEIEKAQMAHDAYKLLMLKSDKILLGCTVGDL